MLCDFSIFILREITFEDHRLRLRFRIRALDNITIRNRVGISVTIKDRIRIKINCQLILGPVVRELDSAIHRIVIFSIALNCSLFGITRNKP